MPVYKYERSECHELFDRLLLRPSEAERRGSTCPACGGAPPRTHASHRFSSPSIGRSGELAEDPEPYRAIHYHEKRGEWERAARAGEGVIEFARKRFQEKARRKEQRGPT